MSGETNVPELAVLVAKWQPKLRLSDWLVTIRYAHQHEFSTPGSEAQCHWQQNLKRAQILIVEPVEYHDGADFPQDIEESVVHELLHLHFCILDDYRDAKETIFEQAIECLATMIVAMDRRQP